MIDPRQALQQATALHQKGQSAEAAQLCLSILAQAPDFHPARHLLGLALASQGRHAEARTVSGARVFRLDRPDEAIAYFDIVLGREPRNVEALIKRGLALRQLGRWTEALDSYAGALAIAPDDITARLCLGMLLNEVGRADEALAYFDQGLKADPNHAGLLHAKGVALLVLQRFADAAECFEAALAIMPDHRQVPGGLATAAVSLCDFDRCDAIVARLLADKSLPVPPLVMMSLTSDPGWLLAVARQAVAQVFGALPPSSPITATDHARLRVAYLSPDFGLHPVGEQIAELLEHHDRTRFEIIGIALRPLDGSATAARILAACDHFRDMTADSDQAIADLLRTAQIDIAIDLCGHTEGTRLGIFAHRAAPVQASWLGYAGTSGADFIDYVIADAVALPMDQQAFFSERIIHLPHSFWAADTTRQVGPPPSRAEAGLPETGVVFCAFTRFSKINRALFDLWLRLLEGVPGSVLWLSGGETASRQNLIRHAVATGIDPARLVFAEQVESREAHLARLALADLFLDTLPYNAHAGASAALWAGVPMITVRGESFAGRVAASLLEALDLGDLVAADLPGYEALALALARDPAALAALKQRLGRHRDTKPLFDMKQRCRDLERAFIRMRAQIGAPKPFALGEEMPPGPQ